MLLALLMATQVAAEIRPCDMEAADRGVQQAMNHCAHLDYLAADEALNVQWKLTADHMKARDAGWHGSEYDDRRGYFEVLLAGQRAWLSYRDAHCASEGYFARGGSLEPLLVSTCMADLTQARTAQLAALAETY